MSLEYINCCIREFNYSLSDRNSRPPELTLPHSRMQAAECWCLIRNLPLMIGQKIPRGNPHWQLLILLLDCMFIIFAPEVTENMAILLSHLVDPTLSQEIAAAKTSLHDTLRVTYETLRSPHLLLVHALGVQA
jgi:hypothetical protein